MWYIFSSPNHFATNMPTCECCDSDKYDNYTMCRGVECSDEERMYVRKRSRGMGGVMWWSRYGKDFLAQHTLLQVYQHVAAVNVMNTTIIACIRVWECSGKESVDVRQRSRGVRDVLWWS